MNPYQLSREMRSLPGNIQSHHLPGGSIVAAVMDRDLMTWSDRGGASRIFGEIWSDHCWTLLGNGSGARAGIFGSTGDEMILRLDANPRIAAQAARNKLSNPDFLSITKVSLGEFSLRSVDAKFAFDRLRRVQVSPEALRALVELPGSLIREEIDQILESNGDVTLQFAPGAFVGPMSLLNDYYYRRLIDGSEPDIPASELHLIPVDAPALFERTDEHGLMELFEANDGLSPFSTETGVLFGMYYLRLASATRWFEEQNRAPLLSLSSPDPVPVEQVLEAAKERLGGGETSYQVIRDWSRSAERATEQQAQVKDAARLPVRMAELRSLLERAGYGDDRKRLKMLRGALERKFMRRLTEEVGEIPARPWEPIPAIVKRVRTTGLKLKPEMINQARSLVQRFSEDAR